MISHKGGEHRIRERKRKKGRDSSKCIGSREVGVIFLQFAGWDFSSAEGINLNSALVLWIFFFLLHRRGKL